MPVLKLQLVALQLPLLIFALMCCANPATGQISRFLGCPVAADLDDGIIYTDPARQGVLDRRYRRLDGPYIGQNYINGIFPDGTTISYSGLFTYKHWRDGKLIQIEEPQTDLTELLKFEAGSTHAFESIRYNPQTPERRWRISAEYRIEAAEDFSIGGCSYSAVQISREGTMTRPDGETKRDRESYIFIPDLLLRVSGTGIYWGDISSIRKRTIFDGKTWPFSNNASDILSN